MVHSRKANMIIIWTFYISHIYFSCFYVGVNSTEWLRESNANAQLLNDRFEWAVMTFANAIVVFILIWKETLMCKRMASKWNRRLKELRCIRTDIKAPRIYTTVHFHCSIIGMWEIIPQMQRHTRAETFMHLTFQHAMFNPWNHLMLR